MAPSSNASPPCDEMVDWSWVPPREASGIVAIPNRNPAVHTHWPTECRGSDCSGFHFQGQPDPPGTDSVKELLGGDP